MALPTFEASAVTAPPGTSSSTVTVTLPTYSAGDIVFIQFAGSWGNPDNTVAATGWTLISRFTTGTTNNNQTSVLYRIMDGTEGTTVTATISGTFPGNSKVGAVAYSYSGIDATPLDTATPVTANATSGSSTYSVGPYTTGRGQEKVLMFMVDQSTGTFTFSNGTKLADNDLIVSTTHHRCILVEQDATSTGSYSESGNLGGFTFYAAMLVGLVGTGGTAYTDSATISGNTTISSIESTDYVENTTVSTTTNISAAESLTTPTDSVDSAIISSTTDLSGSFEEDPFFYVEAGTISTSTSLSYFEYQERLDSSTVSTVTNISSLDAGPYLDDATIDGITTPDVILEIPTTIVTNIILTGNAIATYTLTATVDTEVSGGTTGGGGGGGTVITDPDAPGYTVTYSPAGQWGSSDDDSGHIPDISF